MIKSVILLLAFAAVVILIVAEIIIQNRKFVKHCKERGFTILNKKDAEKFFPPGFSIFENRKSAFWSLKFTPGRLFWYRWLALNQDSREMYFINLSSGGKNPTIVSGIVLKISIDAPYVKICHKDLNVIWSAYGYLYKPYVELPGTKVPGTEYTIYTNATDANAVFDFVTAYAQAMEKAKLNAEVSGHFIIFYKFASDNNPGDFMNNVLPAAEALADIFEVKKQ